MEEIELGGLDEEDGGEYFEDGDDMFDVFVERDVVSFEFIWMISV